MVMEHASGLADLDGTNTVFNQCVCVCHCVCECVCVCVCVKARCFFL